MLLGRLGSLNALAQTRPARGVWRLLLGEHGQVPSADTLARVQSQVEPDAIRDLLGGFYGRLRRNKALTAPTHGLLALVIDGHETSSSYRRCCPGCLRREVAAGAGTRTQYYHRYVVAMLAAGKTQLLVDAEPQRAGEDEVAAATRLLERVAARHPRAFDVVLADALYARTSFFRTVVSLGKDALVVFKQEEWALMQEIQDLCALLPPRESTVGGKRLQLWDVSDLPWAGYQGTVRAVRSLETTRVRRQITKTVEETQSSWIWLMTCDQARVPTLAVRSLGHDRWRIENEGFNEAVRLWHMDHVYRHEPRAMLVMLLLMMLAFDLLHVFYDRNLKPVRRREGFQHVARQVTADLYAPQRPRGPP
jgi:hypothetical protein